MRGAGPWLLVLAAAGWLSFVQAADAQPVRRPAAPPRAAPSQEKPGWGLAFPMVAGALGGLLLSEELERTFLTGGTIGLERQSPWGLGLLLTADLAFIGSEELRIRGDLGALLAFSSDYEALRPFLRVGVGPFAAFGLLGEGFDPGAGAQADVTVGLKHIAELYVGAKASVGAGGPDLLALAGIRINAFIMKEIREATAPEAAEEAPAAEESPATEAPAEEGEGGACRPAGAVVKHVSECCSRNVWSNKSADIICCSSVSVCP